MKKSDIILCEDTRVSRKLLDKYKIKTKYRLCEGQYGLYRGQLVSEFEEVIRQTELDIGFDSSDVCFDGNTCAVINAIGQQSADIALGTHEADEANQGAGDQGLMFGFASEELSLIHI